MNNFFVNNSPYSSNQLRVSQSYFMPPSAGNAPNAAYGALNSASFNPWMSSAASYANTGANTTLPSWGSQSLVGQNVGQTSLPSSVMQGGTYALGPSAYGQSPYGQVGGTTGYFASPQTTGYMPISTIPGLSSYPGAFSVRPQGPSYGFVGGDQFISGPYTGGYDVTGLYNQAPAFPAPRGRYPSVGFNQPGPVGFPTGRRPNPFNSGPALNASRYFVSPQELQNGFDFGLSSILNNKPGNLSSAPGYGQFTSDLSFLANDPLFSQFLDADTLAQINGIGGSSSTNSSSSIDSLLASLLGTGSTTTPANSGGSDNIDALLASFLNSSGSSTSTTSTSSLGDLSDLDPELAAALADFNDVLAPAPEPAPAPTPAPADTPAPTPANNGNGGYSTL